MKIKIFALIMLLTVYSFINGVSLYATDMLVLPQSTLYGADAAKADTELTLNDMLTYAIQDEFLAKSRYLLVIEKFGELRPFSNILISEKVHINKLIPLFSKYNVILPADKSMEYVKTPTSIKESLESGIQAEIENIAMYDRFLKEEIPDDVKTTFISLRNASLNHLQAFRRALQSL